MKLKFRFLFAISKPHVCSYSSERKVMVPSLHWLLLLWRLQVLWAQDYEGDLEDEVVTPRRRSKLIAPNSIPQNGRRKFLLIFQEKKRLVIKKCFQSKKKKKKEHDTEQGTAEGCIAHGLIISLLSKQSISSVTA